MFGPTSVLLYQCAIWLLGTRMNYPICSFKAHDIIVYHDLGAVLAADSTPYTTPIYTVTSNILIYNYIDYLTCPVTFSYMV